MPSQQPTRRLRSKAGKKDPKAKGDSRQCNLLRGEGGKYVPIYKALAVKGLGFALHLSHLAFFLLHPSNAEKLRITLNALP